MSLLPLPSRRAADFSLSALREIWNSVYRNYFVVLLKQVEMVR
jgi:hypothetical protein